MPVRGALVVAVAVATLINRLIFDSDDYDTDGDSIWKNLTTAPHFDQDPFSINQLGHPYQGGIYSGAARSAGRPASIGRDRQPVL